MKVVSNVYENMLTKRKKLFSVLSEHPHMNAKALDEVVREISKLRALIS